MPLSTFRYTMQKESWLLKITAWVGGVNASVMWSGLTSLTPKRLSSGSEKRLSQKGAKGLRPAGETAVWHGT